MDKIVTRKTVYTNSTIIWRIVFSYEIVVYHFLNAYGISTSLHLATEFFFIVSGYIIAAEIDNHKYKDTWDFFSARLKKYAPHYYLSILIEFVIINLLGKTKYGIGDLVSGIFFLQGMGLDTKQWINVPTWYLSVLMYGGFFLCYFLINHKNFLENFIMPAVILTTYITQFNSQKYISHSLESMFLSWDSAFFLGLATMGIGILLYKACAYPSIQIERRKITARIIEGGVLLGVIIGGAIWRKTIFDFVMLGLICIGCLIAFSIQDCILSHSKIIRFFSRLSYPLFLNHNVFRMIWPEYFECSIDSFIIYILAVTLYSILTMFLIDNPSYWEKRIRMERNK